MFNSESLKVGSNCIYVSLLIISNFLSPLFISLWGITFSAGTFTVPIAFAIIDSIANVDKKTANSLIYWGSVSELLFSLTSFGFAIAIASINHSTTQHFYEVITHKMVIGSLGFFIAMIVGQKINSHVFLWLAKQKKLSLLNIKNYSGRLIISSAIGESVYIMIIFPIAFYKDHTIIEILSAAIFSILFKIIMSLMLTKPSKILSSQLGKSKNPSYSCTKVEIHD